MQLWIHVRSAETPGEHRYDNWTKCVCPTILYKSRTRAYTQKVRVEFLFSFFFFFFFAYRFSFLSSSPGRVAQSVGHLTRKSEVLGSIPGLATYFVSSSADSRGAFVSYWRKYVHEALVNRFGGLSLPRKSAVRLTDRPDMTLDFYRGRKTTKQQQKSFFLSPERRLDID